MKEKQPSFTEVSFVRHCEWDGNNKEAESLLHSPRDYEEGLNEEGRRQAGLLREAASLSRLSDEDITVRVIASPYKRATQTARLGSDGPFWIDGGFREQNKGTDPEDYYEDPELFKRPYPSGESLQGTATRGLAAVARARRHFGGNPHIAVVTHARLMFAMRIALHGGDFTRLPNRLVDGSDGVMIPNGAIDTYRIHRDGRTEMRVTPLGENPQEREFFEIPGLHGNAGRSYILSETNQRPSPLEATQAALANGEIIQDPEALNTLVRTFTSKEPLDARQTIQTFADNSPSLQLLFQSDIGLWRAARLGEHTEADLSGFEKDYRLYFQDSSEMLQVMRMAALLRDGGKSLRVAETGSNRQQREYNLQVSEAVLANIDPTIMSNNAQKAVQLLVGCDAIGSLLKGKEERALQEWRAIKQEWPEPLQDHLELALMTSYLSDASAHTVQRNYHDGITGEQKPAVQSHDRTLDFLFQPEVAQATLTPDRQKAVLELLASE